MSCFPYLSVDCCSHRQVVIEVLKYNVTSSPDTLQSLNHLHLVPAVPLPSLLSSPSYLLLYLTLDTKEEDEAGTVCCGCMLGSHALFDSLSYSGHTLSVSSIFRPLVFTSGAAVLKRNISHTY